MEACLAKELSARGTEDDVEPHVKTRAELIEAALADSLERDEDVLREVSIDGDPAETFSGLVASSWTLLREARALLAAAQKELSASRLRELHEKAEARG